MISSIQLSDSDLLNQYVSGDEKSFEILLKRHKDKIYAFIYSKVKDAQLANDIFQETFIKVINTVKMGNYNDEGKFLPWVLRISYNLIIDHFRKIKKIKILSDSFSYTEGLSIFSRIACDEKNVLEKMTFKELKNQIMQLVELLPKSQKSIIIKRLFVGMSFKEIAEEESISINTALGRMRYAVMNIRKMIDKKGIVVDI